MNSIIVDITTEIFNALGSMFMFVVYVVMSACVVISVVYIGVKIREWRRK